MSVVKSVPRAARAKSLFAALSVLLMIAATLFGANVASGDEVWHQSYQRGSASEACVAQAGETPWQDSWGTNPGWSPSWEQWANNGQGGWVCSRSITWARDSAARVYNIGDVGPGGGLVFYIDSTSGLRYEMARKDWGVGSAIDPKSVWTTIAPFCYALGSDTANGNCQTFNLYPGTSGDQSASSTASRAIGMGSANTDAIIARMAAGSVSSSDYAAGLARAYAGGGFTDWFLPSKDELNAMCYYSRNLSATPDPTVSCEGGSGTIQDSTFAASTYGFDNGIDSSRYWSSSQSSASIAWYQKLDTGLQVNATKSFTGGLRVRPVRAF